MWFGATAAGATLYFAPHNSADVLAFDTCIRTTTLTPSGEGEDGRKWSGAAAAGGAVHFGPYSNDNVLELRPVTPTHCRTPPPTR